MEPQTIAKEYCMETHYKKQPLKGVGISDASIKNPVFVMMLMLLGLVLGLLAFVTLPVSLLPDFNQVYVSARLIYPGAGPETVAEQVAEPIEDELASLSGVKEIMSTSSEGIAVIVIEFETGTSANVAVQNVRERIAGIRAVLPADLDDPIIEQLDPTQFPIVTLAFSSQTLQDSSELRTVLEDDIMPVIQSVPSVGSTDLSGGLERQIAVNLDLDRLEALRILPSQVSYAIATANTDVGLGDAVVDNLEVNLRTPSVFASPEAIATVGIAGTPYTIADVARVEESFADVETITRLNGIDTIVLSIRKQSDANTVAVAEGIRAELVNLAAQYPDVQYDIIVDDSVKVQENVRSALEEIGLAVILAILVVWIFFRNLRSTLVTVLGMPIIITATFAGMSLMGLSINMFSLLAISICVGLVIDDAIVIRENIFRHIERGKLPLIAASDGTAQVAGSVLAMTLTIIVVFVPAAFTEGDAGIIFRAFGLTVAIAMVISTVEAFTLAPTTAAHWSRPRPPKEKKIKPGEEHLPDEAHDEPGWMERIYEGLLGWSLRFRFVTVILTALVVVASFWAASGLTTSFLPYHEAYQFVMEFELPAGTPLEETDRWAREAEAILADDPAVASVLTTVGASGGVFGGGGSERASFIVSIHQTATTPETQARLREAFADFPGIVFALPSYVAGLGADVTVRPLQVQVRGPGGVEQLTPVVDQLMAGFAEIEGLNDLGTTYNPGKPALEYRLIQNRANDYGITNQDLALTLRALMDGDTAGSYREGGREIDIVVQLPPAERQGIDTLNSLYLPLGGADVPLQSLAAVEMTSSPASIRRVNRLPEIVIGGNNIGRSLGEVQADMQARIDQLTLPPGVQVSFGGDAAEQDESFTGLLVAMGLSVLFVYMVLASQFNSLFQPLIIMLAMPLSFVGAFFALTLTNLDLNLVSMIGMLMLMGLVVKNSIMLVDFTNQLQLAGMPKNDAIKRAGALRLRPILMTSLTLILASLPAAIGLGAGAELRRGLSTAVIGGMITSTMLTLLVIPVAYSYLQSLLSGVGRFMRWITRRGQALPAAAVVPPVAVQSAAGAAVSLPSSDAGNGVHAQGTNGEEQHSHAGNGVEQGTNGGEQHSHAGNGVEQGTNGVEQHPDAEHGVHANAVNGAVRHAEDGEWRPWYQDD
jgi:HAE1 family hydrophobic/amphiphilic exporter-1